ncbi:MAG: NAD(P)-binding protein [Bacillota bacterium]
MAKTMGEVHEVPTTWTTGWTDIFNTGTWRSVMPVHQRRYAPCHAACPVSGEIPTWIQQLKKGDYQEAWLTLVANNPFPAVTGRVCHHPCELKCNRNEYDEKVSVKTLERCLGDMALEKNWKLPTSDQLKDEKIAVVGAGPAGLSAAYQLRARGFGVTIYEARQQPGGLLYYGIPAYRLPRNILKGEMERLLQTGIELLAGTPLKSPADFKQLEEKYAAVFIATGAQRSLGLPELEGAAEVLDGLYFLERVNEGAPPELGSKVVVIGGGNTAVDAARCALRLGSRDVAILYRRGREQMPAQAEEIAEAEEEGVKLELLAAPIALKKEGQKKILLCRRMRLGAPDASGRQRPEPVAGQTFAMEIDTLICATGAEADLTPLQGVLPAAGSLVQVDGEQGTGRKGFFAGGDLTSRERYVASAIGTGRRGAAAIARFLGVPEEIGKADGLDEDPVVFADINTYYFSSLPTLKKSKAAAARVADFREIEPGIGLDEAAAEAERCFSCGNCLHCDNCFYFCPDMAVQRDETAAEGYRVLDQYCKGCGLCAAECPRGAIVLKEEIK